MNNRVRQPDAVGLVARRAIRKGRRPGTGRAISPGAPELDKAWLHARPFSFQDFWLGLRSPPTNGLLLRAISVSAIRNTMPALADGQSSAPRGRGQARGRRVPALLRRVLLRFLHVPQTVRIRTAGDRRTPELRPLVHELITPFCRRASRASGDQRNDEHGAQHHSAFFAIASAQTFSSVVISTGLTMNTSMPAWLARSRSAGWE